MALGVDFITLIDKRTVGLEQVVSDFFDFPGPPAAGTSTYRTVELPLNVVTPPSVSDPIYVREVHPTTHVPLGPVFTMVTYPTPPLATEFQIHATDTFTFSKIVFNQLDGGKTLEIIYTGRGSLIFAADVNDPRDEIKDGRDTEADMGTRFEKVEDGTRILDDAIRARHITAVSEEFVFPAKVTITGDLDVLGSTTYLRTETLQVDDNIIQLNSNITGAPTEDGGIEIVRGTSTNAQFLWDETVDRWKCLEGGLHLPAGNLDLEHNQFEDAAAENVADQTAETAKVATAVAGQLIFRLDAQALRVFDSVAGSFKSVGVDLVRQDYTAGTVSAPYTGSLTVFDLPWTFNQGSDQLMVYRSGLLQRIGGGFDYTETANNQVTFTVAVTNGENISFVNLAIPV